LYRHLNLFPGNLFRKPFFYQAKSVPGEIAGQAILPASRSFHSTRHASIPRGKARKIISHHPVRLFSLPVKPLFVCEKGIAGDWKIEKGIRHKIIKQKDGNDIDI